VFWIRNPGIVQWCSCWDSKDESNQSPPPRWQPQLPLDCPVQHWMIDHHPHYWTAVSK
jgi:hypothetical protein